MVNNGIYIITTSTIKKDYIEFGERKYSTVLIIIFSSNQRNHLYTDLEFVF